MSIDAGDPANSTSASLGASRLAAGRWRRLAVHSGALGSGARPEGAPGGASLGGASPGRTSPGGAPPAGAPLGNYIPYGGLQCTIGVSDNLLGVVIRVFYAFNFGGKLVV